MKALALALFLLLPQAPAAPPAASPEAGELVPGIEFFDTRHLEEARAFFEPYAAAHPKSAAAAFYLGRIWLELKDADKAVSWMRKAVDLDRDNSDLHRWLARAYGVAAGQANPIAQEGLARDAKTELDQAVRLDPRNLRAREDLVDYYLHSPEFLGGSVQRALQEAEEMRKIDPIAGRMMLANIHFARKEPALADQEYRAAIQEAPADLRPRMALGFSSQAQQHWDAAFEAFEGALKTDPEAWEALYQIGRTAAFSGQQLDRGEECLKRYLAHTPTGDEPPLSGAHFRLGMIYEKKGDPALAREQYQASLALDPANADVRAALARLPSLTSP